MLAKSKRLNPVNVSNPSSHHIARLDFAQAIRLTLLSPTSLGYSSECKWDIKVSGNFLRISNGEPYTDDLESGEFFFEMDKVKPHWSILSNLFLGNVFIYAESIVSGKRELHSVIYAYLNCKNDRKSKVVTVVQQLDCDEVKQRVQLEQRHMLEVVSPDEVLEEYDLSAFSFPLHENEEGDDESLLLKQIRHEIIPIGQTYTNGALSPDHELYTERRILKYNQKHSPLFREHHFFFSWPHNFSYYLKKLNDGCLNASNVLISAKPPRRLCDEGKDTKFGKLDVLIRVRGSVRLSEGKKEKYDSLISQKNDFRRRHFNEDSRILVNPNQTERIFLYGEDDEFFVEVVSPSVYFGDIASDYPNAMWSAKIESAHVQAKWMEHLNFVQMRIRWIGNVKVQVFSIQMREAKQRVEKEVILGRFILYCPELEPKIKEHHRVIFVLYKSTKKGKKKNKGSSYRNEGYISSSHSNVKSNIDPYWDVDITDYGDDLSKGESLRYIKITTTSVNRKLKKNMSIYPPLGDSRLETLSEIREYSLTPCNHCGEGYYDPNRLNKNGDALCYICGKAENPTKATMPLSIVAKNERESLSDKRREKNENNKITRIANEILTFREKEKERTENQEEGKRRGISTDDRKRPYEIYGPQSRQEVELSKGQPLFIYAILPKGEFKSSKLRRQWTVGTIDMSLEDGLKLWVHQNELVEPHLVGVVHQKVEIRPIIPKNTKPGRHLVGAVVFRSQKERKFVYVYVKVENEDSKRGLKWEMDYNDFIADSTFVPVGRPFKRSYSTLKNRTTLVDPIGRSVNVYIGENHDLELIVKGVDDKESGAFLIHGWNVLPRIIGQGKLKVLDNTFYKTFAGESFLRVLLRFSNIGEDFCGEIKINRNGNDTHTRISVSKEPNDYKVDSNAQDNKFKQYGLVNIIGQIGDRNVLRIEDWRDDQEVVVFPYEKVYVAIPNQADFLNEGLKSSSSYSNWEIECHQCSLSQEVYNALPHSLKKEINPEKPFYKNWDFLYPSESPDKFDELLLPSLEESQPLIFNIQDAMEKIYGVKADYPLAEFVFKCKVDDRFVISQRLKLSLGNYTSLALGGEGKPRIEPIRTITFNDPYDHSQMAIFDQEEVIISLPYKYKVTDNKKRSRWRCDASPIWMLRVDRVDDKENERELFVFRCKSPTQLGYINGTISFVNKEAGDLKKRIFVKNIKVKLS